jgi:hypothetical protein
MNAGLPADLVLSTRLVLGDRAETGEQVEPACLARRRLPPGSPRAAARTGTPFG